jgi:hypothetical protein
MHQTPSPQGTSRHPSGSLSHPSVSESGGGGDLKQESNGDCWRDNASVDSASIQLDEHNAFQSAFDAFEVKEVKTEMMAELPESINLLSGLSIPKQEVGSPMGMQQQQQQQQQLTGLSIPKQEVGSPMEMQQQQQLSGLSIPKQEVGSPIGMQQQQQQLHLSELSIPKQEVVSPLGMQFSSRHPSGSMPLPSGGSEMGDLGRPRTEMNDLGQPRIEMGDLGTQQDDTAGTSFLRQALLASTKSLTKLRNRNSTTSASLSPPPEGKVKFSNANFGGITLCALSFCTGSFRPGHFVPWYISSPVILSSVISSWSYHPLIHFVTGHFVAGHFVP